MYNYRYIYFCRLATVKSSFKNSVVIFFIFGYFRLFSFKLLASWNIFAWNKPFSLLEYTEDVSSKVNDSYFLMLAYDALGGYWCRGIRGWTFTSVSHSYFVLLQRAAEWQPRKMVSDMKSPTKNNYITEFFNTENLILN